MSFLEIYAECRLEFMAQTLPVQRFTRNFVRRFCKEEIEEIISLNPDLFETMIFGPWESKKLFGS